MMHSSSFESPQAMSVFNLLNKEYYIILAQRTFIYTVLNQQGTLIIKVILTFFRLYEFKFKVYEKAKSFKYALL